MQQITLEIADDYIQKFTALLEALPTDKIQISSESELEDLQFGKILNKDNNHDFVPKEDVFKALKNENQV